MDMEAFQRITSKKHLVDLHQEYLEKKLKLKNEKIIGEFFSYSSLQIEDMQHAWCDFISIINSLSLHMQKYQQAMSSNNCWWVCQLM